ncbi:MAG: glutamate--tRNA ligase [Gammaproteobacteria bacterium]|nr:glutamate--tRNA ligase [Gammaproteobacteria bacterium]
MSVRTRFAPSPTGYLHIGSARTALFCYLFARQQGGEYILRIEDTDRERSTSESVQAIHDGLEWLGLKQDEGPFFQTERFDRYREVIDQLLESGHAYHCYCTPEELDAMRETAMAKKEKPRYNGYWRDRKDTPPDGVKPVVRFKNPLTGSVVINDLVKGDIEVENAELDDLILLRSDGSPTYNLSVVVDDIDMQISHVIRGDDHVNNTVRQINLFSALGATLPAFAHLPMILGEDGKRLSKRHGAVSVMQYQQQGYLPDALLNYLVRLGWSHQDQELFSRDEMIQLFSLEAVNRAGAVFDNKKLEWVNQQHIQQLPADELAVAVQPYLQNLDTTTTDAPALSAVVDLLRERAKTLVELAQSVRYFYQAPREYDPKAAKKQLTSDAMPRLERMMQNFEALEEWKPAAIEAAIQNTVDSLEVGFGKIGLPLRVAITGSTASPALDQTLALIGRPQTLTRLQSALDWGRTNLTD